MVSFPFYAEPTRVVNPALTLTQFISFLICYLGRKSSDPQSLLKIKAFEYSGIPRCPYPALPLTSCMILGKLLHLLYALTLNCEMVALIELA